MDLFVPNFSSSTGRAWRILRLQRGIQRLSHCYPQGYTLPPTGTSRSIPTISTSLSTGEIAFSLTHDAAPHTVIAVEASDRVSFARGRQAA